MRNLRKCGCCGVPFMPESNIADWFCKECKPLRGAKGQQPAGPRCQGCGSSDVYSAYGFWCRACGSTDNQTHTQRTAELKDAVCDAAQAWDELGFCACEDTDEGIRLVKAVHALKEHMKAGKGQADPLLK